MPVSIAIVMFAQSANPADQPVSGPKCRSAACDQGYWPARGLLVCAWPEHIFTAKRIDL